MTEMQMALIANLVTLVVAVGGWVITYKINNKSNELKKTNKRVSKLETEVRARIALEKETAKWLAELTGRTGESVKREARSRTAQATGLRPKLSESYLISNENTNTKGQTPLPFA